MSKLNDICRGCGKFELCELCDHCKICDRCKICDKYDREDKYGVVYDLTAEGYTGC